MDNEKSEQNFCNNVKKLMTDYKLNDTQMMEIMNISRKTLKKIKSGIMPPRMNIAVVFRLQRHFGVNNASMFTEQYKITVKGNIYGK